MAYSYNSLYKNCTLCPRSCNVDRTSQLGFCQMGAKITAARAALHYWEEPLISCPASGAVFFSGCNLKCIFCQNYNIAQGNVGKEISTERLAEIFIELQEKGAANINLVTAAPYVPSIIDALISAKEQGLSIPIVYNSSGYESISTLRLLDGLIDIYLPDLKYYSSELSNKLSKAPDYFAVASAAIEEMVRQTGKPIIDENSSLMTKGVIVRHLCLPGQSKDTKKILRYLHETYEDNIYISIMNQYTPIKEQLAKLPEELQDPLSQSEYNKIILFAERLGLQNAFIQEQGTSEESFIPAFDYEGL